MRICIIRRQEEWKMGKQPEFQGNYERVLDEWEKSPGPGI